MYKPASLPLCSLVVLAGFTIPSRPGVAHADLELPRASPAAKVGVTIGLTDVLVEYSSPEVKGRKIWGGLVPYDKVWRTGANMATKITFSKDVTVGDKPVPAGSYGLFTIPGVTSWTVILSKTWNVTGNAYKAGDDVARFDAKPKVAPMREHLTFLFNEFSDKAATLDLEWEKLRVSLPIKAKTDEQVAANIKAMDDGTWRPYANAARYLLDGKKEPERAMELIDKSLAMKEEWLNLYVKAALLAQKGKYKDAYPIMQKAQTLGEKAGEGFYLAPEVKKALAEWKTKS